MRSFLMGIPQALGGGSRHIPELRVRVGVLRFQHYSCVITRVPAGPTSASQVRKDDYNPMQRNAGSPAVIGLKEKKSSYVSGTRDWGRLWQGGYNSEANTILYKVLTNSAELAELADYSGDSELSAAWSTTAWDGEGMYKDNLTSLLFPQDANSLAVLFNLTDSAEQASRISEGLARYWNEFGSVAPESPNAIAPFIGGFELQAHFIAGNDGRAVDLLHREWGYMLYTPLSVQSTLLEGYTSNCSLYYRSCDDYNYDPSYVSHSHGWSTGPTSASMYYILGLTVTSPKVQPWSVAPHTSGLPCAEGGLETPLGSFGVNWSSSPDAFEVSVSTPEGTSGVVKLPINGTVIVDGSEVDGGGSGLIEFDGGDHIVYGRS